VTCPPRGKFHGRTGQNDEQRPQIIEWSHFFIEWSFRIDEENAQIDDQRGQNDD